MTQHTPGPWNVNDEGNVCLPNGSDMIAWVASPDDMEVFGESPESLANARLIAAAPELFEYVESSASAGCATAKALIAKIKGDNEA